jgi:hypothetical protein
LIRRGFLWFHGALFLLLLILILILPMDFLDFMDGAKEKDFPRI